MRRVIFKAARDLLVIAVGSALLALAEHSMEFGVPAEAVPFVSAAALFLYRMLRERSTKVQQVDPTQ